MDFDLSEKAKSYQEKVIRFMEEHIYPIENEVSEYHAKIKGLYASLWRERRF